MISLSRTTSSAWKAGQRERCVCRRWGQQATVQALKRDAADQGGQAVLHGSRLCKCGDSMCCTPLAAASVSAQSSCGAGECNESPGEHSWRWRGECGSNSHPPSFVAAFLDSAHVPYIAPSMPYPKMTVQLDCFVLVSRLCICRSHLSLAPY